MKTFSIFLSFLFLVSCGDNKTKESTNTATTGVTLAPDAAKGMELVAKSDCISCHKESVAFVGPSYAAIAAKYKTLDQPAMDSMVKQIIDGGSGRWGTVPMTPHKDMPKDEAQLMVHYIMSVKK